MLPAERRNDILKLVREQETVTVSALAVKYSVTEETIRRDLEKLEKAGSLMRTHGGAMLIKEDSPRTEQPATIRRLTNVPQKTAIASLVAELIQDGDAVLLDDSSTSLFVARALKPKKGLTVITNSLDVILELSDRTDWNVMSTGGVLRQRSNSFVGNHAETTVSSFYADKAILSCKGIDLERGFSESNEPCAMVKRKMLSSAREVILAIDSSKFDLISFVRIGALDSLTTLVTDRRPDERWLEVLEENKIRCIWAEA